MDEMWSFVYDRGHQCWLWYAVDHCTGEVLAYAFGVREYCVLEGLLLLLRSFSIFRVYVGGGYVYEKVLGAGRVKVGKRYTQKIERKHLSLRTWVKRLARKTMCFSKSLQMHKIVVGLCINVKIFKRSLTS
jgi:insertion element IS1 protein InsB